MPAPHSVHQAGSGAEGQREEATWWEEGWWLLCRGVHRKKRKLKWHSVFVPAKPQTAAAGYESLQPFAWLVVAAALVVATHATASEDSREWTAEDSGAPHYDTSAVRAC